VIGRKYSVSWVQLGYGNPTDNIHVSIKGEVEDDLYSNLSISEEAWETVVREFEADSVEVVLKFKNVNMSANMDGAFIDEVTFNLVG
jgi:hypothetical protein